MLLEGEQALVRVGVQMGLVDKVLEEEEQERKNAWILLLNKLFEAQFFEDLLKKSEQCVLEFPNWYLGYFGRGIAKDNLKNIKAAILDYNKAISFNPYVGRIYKYRGAAKLKVGDYQGSKKDYAIVSDFIEAPAMNNEESKEYPKFKTPKFQIANN